MSKKSNLKQNSGSVAIDNIKERKIALENAIKQIEKNFGKGAIMKLGSKQSLDIDSIATGSLCLDIALGIGGIPKGRITEIYGPESSGKTTVALSVAAQSQKNGGTVAFIDVEHALDPKYAKILGVDIDSLLVSQPESGEQALEIIESLVRSGAVDVVILDSVAAMTTKAEIEGEMGDANIGLQARLMSQAMRKLTSIINKTNCAAIFINQIREKIGVLFGNPETTPGGRALKFYSSVRIDVRKGEKIKKNGQIIGNRVHCKITKNKVAPPFKEAYFNLIYGVGISYVSEILDIAVNFDIIEKSGAWFSYKGQKIGQGKENSEIFLKNNPSILKEVEKLVKEKIKNRGNIEEISPQNELYEEETMPFSEDEILKDDEILESNMEDFEDDLEEGSNRELDVIPNEEDFLDDSQT